MDDGGVETIPSFDVLEGSVEAIENADIPVWAFHQEAPSVFEISPSPQTPSNAVDNLIYVQETIKTIASKLNFHATFHPEAFDKSNTVAQYVYLSINEAEEEQDHSSRQR